MNPILKWAGGKGKVLDRFSDLYKGARHKRYIDLFCGSLSLPLKLVPKNAIFNDVNNKAVKVLYETFKDSIVIISYKNLEKYLL